MQCISVRMGLLACMEHTTVRKTKVALMHRCNIVNSAVGLYERSLLTAFSSGFSSFQSQ